MLIVLTRITTSRTIGCPRFVVPPVRYAAKMGLRWPNVYFQMSIPSSDGRMLSNQTIILAGRGYHVPGFFGRRVAFKNIMRLSIDCQRRFRGIVDLWCILTPFHRLRL